MPVYGAFAGECAVSVEEERASLCGLQFLQEEDVDVFTLQKACDLCAALGGHAVAVQRYTVELVLRGARVRVYVSGHEESKAEPLWCVWVMCVCS